MFHEKHTLLFIKVAPSFPSGRERCGRLLTGEHPAAGQGRKPRTGGTLEAQLVRLDTHGADKTLDTGATAVACNANIQVRVLAAQLSIQLPTHSPEGQQGTAQVLGPCHLWRRSRWSLWLLGSVLTVMTAGGVNEQMSASVALSNKEVSSKNPRDCEVPVTRVANGSINGALHNRQAHT